MKHLVLIGSLVQAIFLSSYQAKAQTAFDSLVFMTEQYPPYNFEEKGQIQGIAVDILGEIMKKLGSKKTINDIQMLPWSRAYKDLQTVPNTCLFSIARNNEREKLFKWVGPIVDVKQVLLAKKSKKIKIAGVTDMNKLQIGVIKDDIMDQTIRKLGVKEDSIQRTSTTKANISKLVLDRIDALAYGDLGALWELKASGYDTTQFETIHTFEKVTVYYGMHKDTSPEVIEKMQKAIDELKAEGKISAIVKKYTGS
ncbi:MAG: transporter substrate-binding domain-containing protein [Oligoflexales bacterium]|nr:transporter substrate-binding domain-containing protein [Oligoflexales bacterium]